MRKILFSFFMASIVGLCTVCVPHSARAALITFDVVPNPVPGDRATIIDVHIDPKSQNLNVVQGAISFQGMPGDQLSVEADTTGSVLSLWPTSPQYASSTATVGFTGGIPGGFDREGLLFRLRVATAMAGTLQISLVNSAVYLNDGKGTEENIAAQPITLTMNPQGSGTVWVPNVILILLLVGILGVALWVGYKKYVKK